ncbi:MAG: cobyrinic acid a,c-diamide synthase [Planctomycetota bacterium]|nr:cobyrinic acid a,c-diamide synthase [Planctomycetota bacterium]
MVDSSPPPRCISGRTTQNTFDAMTPLPPAILVAGTHSGSGKTTVTRALMAALVRRGKIVQGFKAGPDFIDPGHHTAITGRISRNVDTWMMGPEASSASYRRNAAGADIAVIEGVMGLFDGRGTDEDAGSTADLARLWNLPVILVVDAKGMARSIAAMAHGYATYDARVNVAGIVANRVGGVRHYQDYLRPALRQGSSVEPLGYLLRDPRIEVPSRHLGLLTAEEFAATSEHHDALADAAEASIDFDRLLALAQVPTLNDVKASLRISEPTGRRVAVARDRAFCFYYEDNLDALRDAGAEIIPFSPLADRELPAGIDLLYLGGGYPEIHAEALSGNAGIRESIRRYHRDGGAIYAECGGMMACARSLRDLHGHDYPMWDLIPARTVMQSRFAALAYVTARTTGDGLLGPAGTEARGHEFHYSTKEPLGPLQYATELRSAGREVKPDGITIGGLLAGYAHLHFGSNLAVVRGMLAK